MRQRLTKICCTGEQRLYDEWLARQPPPVDRQSYPSPSGVARRPPQEGGEERELSCAERWERQLDAKDVSPKLARTEAGPAEAAAMTPLGVTTLGPTSWASNSTTTRPEGRSDSGGAKTSRLVSSFEKMKFMAAASAEEDASEPVDLAGRDDDFVLSANVIDLEDYAHELAFLPDLAEVVPSELDYDGPNVKSSCHTPEQATRLIKILKKHKAIMISSGNALPPPAYGVVGY
ncbi:unnamed protein product [Phytophthora lilii]|uniref:Unnamed protein product n=1 Tax=Phytophthora lilii TaxID=2077276 RepID=A0A9W6T8T7_9STRA|nr:unnamed protein product [Phytophthora lilii]